MADLQILSAEVCPFAQRSLILLGEKGLDYDLQEIDLSNKPDWFDAVSPYSKVPVLVHGDVTLYESSIVNEYIDEVFPEPPMMPVSAAERAEARIWIDYDNIKFVPLFYKVLLAKNMDQRQVLATALVDALLFIEQNAMSKRRGGRYWMGDSFSLVDMAVYPHFERLAVLEHYRGISIPDSCGGLREWMAAVRERSSVQETAHGTDFHIEAYSKYADGTADGSTAKDMLT
jgi:glutathione S-transferase